MNRIALVLVAMLSASIIDPVSIKAQDVPGGTCRGRALVPLPSLRSDLLLNYSLQAVTRPPTRVLNPGETYQIRYNVVTRCANNCAYLKNTYLEFRAVLGSDRSRLDRSRRDRSQQPLSTLFVRGHKCGDARVIFARFTVPVLTRLGGSQRNVQTVSMGLCPSHPLYNCAGHTIRVRNVSVGGWRISSLGTGQRAIGGGVNRVPSGRRLTLRATLRNLTGRSVPFTGTASTYLNQVTGPSNGPRTRISLKPLPAVANGQSRLVIYNVGPLSPGIYTYKACISGLKDTRGYPLPEHCGPPTAITAGNPIGAAWRVFAVRLSPNSLSIPNARFTLQGSLLNRTSINSPPGARFLTMWRRVQGEHTVGVRASYRETGFVRRRIAKSISFVMQPLPQGNYEFRACATDNIHEPPIRMLCGPWSTIAIAGGRVENTPIPPAVRPNNRSAGCSGGRIRNASQRCVCPRGYRWNPRSGWCYPPSRGNRYVPPATRRPVAIRCTSGWVRQGRCYCPRGRYRVRTGRYSYSCRLTARQTQPRNTYRTPPPTARLRCIGGQVRGSLCWCGFGRFPQRVGNNIYRCR